MRAVLRPGVAVLTAVTVLATPAALPLSASAATNQLTVTTIGRDGAAVASTVSVLNLGNYSSYLVASGKATPLPRGRYAVLADVANPRDHTDTFGAVFVDVAGNTRATIDARAGRPVRMDLTPAVANGSPSLKAVVCVDGPSSGSVIGYNTPGNLYVIPNASPALKFGVISTWTEPAAAGPGAAYVVLGSTRGLPRDYARTVPRSGLARVLLEARRGPAGSPSTGLAVQPPNSDCFSALYTGVSQGEAPFRQQAYLSPGTWQLRADTSYGSDSIGGQTRVGTFAAGKSYGQVFFASAWGPGGYLPVVLRKRLSFSTGGMFLESMPGSGYGYEGASRSMVTLSKGGRILKRQARTDWGSADTGWFLYPIKAAGWYDLTVDASRYRPGITYPADLLSPRTTASFRFRADPRRDEVARVFLTRFIPQGLTISNQAAPGSTTPIVLQLERPAQDPDAKVLPAKPKSVTVEASYDNGRTWRTVRVTGSGTRLSAAVPNPRSGFVSLRSTVVTTTGERSMITIYRAYGIG